MKLLSLLFFVSCWFANLHAQPTRISIHFDVAKFNLKASEQVVLDKFLTTLKAPLSTYKVILVGHTDSDGNAVYNQKLSQNRCKTIKDYLLTQGVHIPQISYEGKGYNAPVASNRTLDGKAQNRRVEILFLSHETTEQPLGVPEETITFDASEGVNYTYSRSGTMINIPPNALIYEDGTPVKGEVDVRYREFRDVADFIATDIPMLYDHQHQFESAGMFEMEANQGDRSVFLKKDAFVDVEFMMTSDTIDNLNFYAYKDGKWQTLGALDRTTQENTFDVQPTCQERYSYRMPRLEKDTLTTFLNAMKTGYSLSKEDGFEQFYKLGFLSLEERFNDFRYIDDEYIHYKFDRIDWDAVARRMPVSFEYNEEYIQVDPLLKEIRLPNGLKTWFKTGRRRGTKGLKTDALRAIEERGWMVLSKGKHQAGDRAKALKILTNSYMDIRVHYLGNLNFQFILKGIGQYDTLVAQPIFTNIERKNKEEVCNMIIANYNRKHQAREKQFDKRVAFYEENWSYFLAFSKSIMPADERCYGLYGWLRHFDKNQSEMTRRYYAYSGLSGNESLIEPLLTKAVQGSPISLDEIPNLPEEALAQRLRVNGFGVYNCDAIRKMGEERLMITAEFLDEEGELVDIKSVNVVDYEMNGIVRFYSNEFTFNPTRKVALIVRDYFGESYIVSVDEMKQYAYKKGNKTYALTIEPIVNNTVNSIRDALAMQ